MVTDSPPPPPKKIPKVYKDPLGKVPGITITTPEDAPAVGAIIRGGGGGGGESNIGVIETIPTTIKTTKQTLPTPDSKDLRAESLKKYRDKPYSHMAEDRFRGIQGKAVQRAWRRREATIGLVQDVDTPKGKVRAVTPYSKKYQELIDRRKAEGGLDESLLNEYVPPPKPQPQFEQYQWKQRIGGEDITDYQWKQKSKSFDLTEWKKKTAISARPEDEGDWTRFLDPISRTKEKIKDYFGTVAEKREKVQKYFWGNPGRRIMEWTTPPTKGEAEIKTRIIAPGVYFTTETRDGVTDIISKSSPLVDIGMEGGKVTYDFGSSRPPKIKSIDLPSGWETKGDLIQRTPNFGVPTGELTTSSQLMVDLAEKPYKKPGWEKVVSSYVSPVFKPRIDWLKTEIEKTRREQYKYDIRSAKYGAKEGTWANIVRSSGELGSLYKSGERFSRGAELGFYEELSEKPIKTGLTTAAFTVVPTGLKLLGSLGKLPITGGLFKATTFGVTKVAPVVYGGSKIFEMSVADTLEQKGAVLGRTAVEIGAMGTGLWLGKTAQTSWSKLTWDSRKSMIYDWFPKMRRGTFSFNMDYGYKTSEFTVGSSKVRTISISGKPTVGQRTLFGKHISEAKIKWLNTKPYTSMKGVEGLSDISYKVAFGIGGSALYVNPQQSLLDETVILKGSSAKGVKTLKKIKGVGDVRSGGKYSVYQQSEAWHYGLEKYKVGKGAYPPPRVSITDSVYSPQKTLDVWGFKTKGEPYDFSYFRLPKKAKFRGKLMTQPDPNSFLKSKGGERAGLYVSRDPTGWMSEQQTVSLLREFDPYQISGARVGDTAGGVGEIFGGKGGAVFGRGRPSEPPIKISEPTSAFADVTKPTTDGKLFEGFKVWGGVRPDIKDESRTIFVPTTDIFDSGRGGTDVRPFIKYKPDVRAGVDIKPTIKIGSDIRSRLRVSVKSRIGLATEQIQEQALQSQLITGRGRGRVREGFEEIIEEPPPEKGKFWFPNWDLPKWSKSFGKPKKKVSFRRPFGRSPSVEAVAFKIYGKYPKRLTGLEVRPIMKMPKVTTTFKL